MNKPRTDLLYLKWFDDPTPLSLLSENPLLVSLASQWCVTVTM